MEWEYPVIFADQTVGHVQIQKRGLYQHLNCRCQLPDGLYRLYAKGVGEEIHLGVLVPEEGFYVLKKHISVANFCCDQPVFYLVTSGTAGDTVSSDQPFPRLGELEFAYWDTEGYCIKYRHSPSDGSCVSSINSRESLDNKRYS